MVWASRGGAHNMAAYRMYETLCLRVRVSREGG